MTTDTVSTDHILRRSYRYSPSNPKGYELVIRPPAPINNREIDEEHSIRLHQTDVLKKHAWRSDNKPIILKDPDGFELRIPWRVGRNWRVWLFILFLEYKSLLTSFLACAENGICDWYKNATEA